MKRRKKRPKTPKSQHPISPRTPRVSDRRLIAIDERPLREKAVGEFHRTMAKFEKARAQWQRFTQEDQPAYGRWVARTFGALLTEERENARQIHELDQLIEEVEIEQFRSTRMSGREAYARVMQRRENPDAFASPEEGDANADQDSETNGHDPDDPADSWDEDSETDDAPFEPFADAFSTKDRRAMFKDFLQSLFGVRPNQLDQAEYESMFAQFEAQMFGTKGQRQNRGAPPPPGAGPSVESRAEARIKEIYRTLVKRLHPDRQTLRSGADDTLWHEVQEAYAARDLDRLETLWAATELQDGSEGKNASLSQLQGASKELNRGLKAFQRSLSKAKHDPAWGFSEVTDTLVLEKRLRRELEQALSIQRSTLAEFRSIISEWSRPVAPRQQKKTKAKRNDGKIKPNPKTATERWEQADLFPF